MLLAEGMLPLSQAAAWSLLAAPTLVWSLRGEQFARKETTSSSVMMAGVTSLLFAATLLPLPVPVVGATSHICLTPVLALIVGVRRMVWPTFFVLLLQAVFFAHGGLTTLGVNVFTLGFLGPLITVGCWKLLRKIGADNGFSFALVCALGGLSVYVMDAMILALALADAVSPVTTFSGVVLGFAPVQLPLAALEAVASLGMIRVMAERRPGLLPESLRLLRKIPINSSSVSLFLLSVVVSGCQYQGIDGTIFGAAAESAGRPPTDSLLDWSQGEVGLAMSVIILFGLGFIAGRSWERLMNEPPQAGEAVEVQSDALSR